MMGEENPPDARTPVVEGEDQRSDEGVLLDRGQLNHPEAALPREG